MFCRAAALSLLATLALPATAQDSDQDGIPDAADTFPCDSAAASVAFSPSETGSGLMLFEDQWPAAGDLDFNDVVIAHHTEIRSDASGRARRVRMVIEPLALGGAFDNGLGLHLPVARSAVLSATVQVGSGPATALALSSADAQATLILSPNLRALFGGLDGPLNSDAVRPRTRGQVLTVEVLLSSSAAISIGAAPFDLYVLRADQPSLEIHRPAYGGTAAMNTALFGTAEDRSAPGRSFVDARGLPFALPIAELAPYPAEGAAISSLFPDIIAFATSAGAQHADYYQSTVVAAHAYADRDGLPALAPTAIAAAGAADRACIPVCAAGTGNCDGAPANGCETNLATSNTSCGACGNACGAALSCVSGMCLPPSCNPGRANCDNVAANGCETDTQTSNTHCGGCGISCGAGQACYSGACAATCASNVPVTFPPVASCANIAPQGVASASSSYAGSPASGAIDGSRCTYWNAGGYAPAWWRVDFGAVRTFRGVTLVAAMSPSPAAVAHVVETSNDNTTWTTRANINTTYSANASYSYDFGGNVSARYVRVRTTSSPSWVAWLDIGVFSCP